MRELFGDGEERIDIFGKVLVCFEALRSHDYEGQMLRK
jgi:hypothetical protein